MPGRPVGGERRLLEERGRNRVAEREAVPVRRASAPEAGPRSPPPARAAPLPRADSPGSRRPVTGCQKPPRAGMRRSSRTSGPPDARRTAVTETVRVRASSNRSSASSTAPKARASASSTAPTSTGRPELALHRGHARLADAAGDDQLEVLQRRVHVQREAVRGEPARRCARRSRRSSAGRRPASAHPDARPLLDAAGARCRSSASARIIPSSTLRT